jgi:phosphatidylglycerophosphatase C
MTAIAIYDLDKTLLSKPTFTAFLIFACRRRGAQIWWRAALWIGALIGFKVKLYGRKPLKQFGIKLFVGRAVPAALSKAFAASIVPSNIQPGAQAALKRDRAEGRMLIIATAAPDFYSKEIAAAAGFDVVIATTHAADANGDASYFIHGENCYGDEKLLRILSWMQSAQMKRESCNIRFYTDHTSDAPMLDWANEGVLINANAAAASIAAAHGWAVQDWR